MDANACEHDYQPKHAEQWDDAKHAALPTPEVKKRFPRQQCTKCRTVYYHSLAHYVAGDW